MQCSNCKKTLPDEALFCCFCGEKINPTCSNCGHELLPDANFCFKCGAAVGSEVKTDAPTESISSGFDTTSGIIIEDRTMNVLDDSLMRNLAGIKENIEWSIESDGIEISEMTTLGDCDCASGECDCDGSIWR